MIPISKKSSLEKLAETMKKEAFSIDRISQGFAKKDPFAGVAKDDVWKVVGNKVLKNKNYK